MEYLVVAGVALIDFWAALPPAIIMKTDPLLTGLVIGVGSSLGVVLTVSLCVAFRAWVTTKFGKDGYVGARTEKFMAKYGCPGLGLLSPIIFGPVLTCAGAIALGAKTKQIAAWGVAGVWLWACAVTVVLTLGHGSELLRVVH